MYYVRAIVAGVLGLIGWTLYSFTAIGLLGGVAETLQRKPGIRDFWLGWSACLVITLSANYVFGKLMIWLMPAEQGPGWLRHGLFDGRHAGRVPWTTKHEQLDRWSDRIAAVAGAVFVVTMPILLALFDDKPGPGWRSWLVADLMGGVMLFGLLATVFVVCIGLWRFVHLRLRPLPIHPGFEPLMPVEPPSQAEHGFNVPPAVSGSRDALPVQSAR